MCKIGLFFKISQYAKTLLAGKFSIQPKLYKANNHYFIVLNLVINLDYINIDFDFNC